jgi:DNA-binding response OmpR family regulator
VIQIHRATSSRETVMQTGTEVPVIAIFNASEDTVDILTTFFGCEGFRAVGRTWPACEPLDPEVVLRFMSEHDPDVIVFDVSLPYDANWQRFLEFQRLGKECRAPAVLTTTNKRALTDCVGSTDALEIVGKPYDLYQLLLTVRRTLASRRRGANP